MHYVNTVVECTVQCSGRVQWLSEVVECSVMPCPKGIFLVYRSSSVVQYVQHAAECKHIVS